MAKKSTREEKEKECLPDNLRCSRTDGRQWRCRRRAMENVKFCEIHYLQGRLRQNREKVPDSLKLQRNMNKKKKRKKLMKNDVVEIIRAKKKKKRNQKQCDVQLDLIRMVLQREVEKKKKNKKDVDEESELHYSEGELRKELPNGVMEIAPPVSTSYDVGFHSNVTVTPRYFRSKNVDRRIAYDNFHVVGYGGNLKKGRRKKCHWCQRSESWSLIKCSTCQKEFFCMDCIKERYFDTQNEVKMACPVCRGTCTCKDCWANQCKDTESKKYLAGISKVDTILHFHYLVCLLLPVLKQISEDQHTALETEAKIKGKRISDILIKQVEFSCNEKIYCNYCKTLILNLHRSCLSCSYSLCLRCCQALSQESTSEDFNSFILKLRVKANACIASESYLLSDKAIYCDNDTSMLIDWTSCNGADSVSCPPTELGGCGNGQLDLRCVYPLSWIKEMEVKAEEIVCSYDFPESLDKNSSCLLCIDKDHKTYGYKQLQDAAHREGSNDNCLFYPTVLDISSDHFEHFQKHWGKGHPIVVRDVLHTHSTPNLSWDPLVMFCAYLERSIAGYENNKDLLEACLDWWEVEIDIKHFCTGSLKCEPHKNAWHETLKLNGWLSSQLFKEQFPAHFSEVINSLPLQEYMNPMSGLLNLAANLPEESKNHDIGPYVYISYGCADKEAYSVTNLCFDPYDVVNIMAHTTDIPLSTDYLTKITKLLKKHRTLCQTGSSTTSEHAKEREQKELQSKETDFLRRVNRTSHISTEVKTIAKQSIETNTSSNGECDSDSDTGKAQRSSPFNKSVQRNEMSPTNSPRKPFENSDKRTKFTVNSAAQWDVFRRQDVPKLIEYLTRHSDELSCTSEYHSKKMVHPILDQSFFLDRSHKTRLKEEFEIEPWTFEQNVGEAVIIPAGCPYQIRNPKSCVHVVLEFVSPENVTECIQLDDVIGRLPEDHIANVDNMEVKKMALNSMRTAIKEIRELTSKR